MPYYYDKEDRFRQQEDAAYRASLKPKVSDAEAVSSAKGMDGPTIEEIEEMDEIGDNDVKW